jgi:erythronate-4-phosphate dehydrogenase
MNILTDENIPLLESVLRSAADVSSAAGREINREMLLKSRSDAIVVRSLTKINANLLEGTNVKFVGTSTSGIDHVDVEYLNDKGIEFAYAPGSNANSVAEYVVYSLLMWAKANEFSLRDKTIGIIGYGNIGKIVAAYSNALGLKVLVNDPPLKDSEFDFPDDVEYMTLDEICKESDILTNHVPLTKAGNYKTAKLISRSKINLLKAGSFLIHTSRGGVVDEKSLLERLARRELTASIDVWENEPLVNSSLLKYSFLATPHIAGYAYDGKLKGALMMAEALEKYSGIQTSKEILQKELETGAEKINPFAGHTVVLKALERNRNLQKDYLAFLQSMLIDDEKERAAAFDRLRKEYPHRRECLTL